MQRKITKRLLDSLEAKPGQRLRVADTELPGFAAVLLESGRVTFTLRYGGKHHRQATIGAFGPLTVEQARAEAKRLLGDVAHGTDPLATRQAQRAAGTLEEWITTHLAEVEPRKRSAGDDKRYLTWFRNRPGMAKRRLPDITADDVIAAFELRCKKHGKVSANRFLASIRTCLQAAWRAGLVPENVARRCRPLPENPPRARVLSDEELAKVLQALDGLADPHVRLAFELLLSTGARKSEVLRARWDDLDLDPDGATWRLPATKAGKPQTIPLPRQTVAMLRNTPRVGDWLIPGRDPKQPREDLRKPWQAIRKAAGCLDVTIHDVRRTYGLAVAKAAGLHVASKLLRHSTVRVTEQVYTPLGVEDLRRATEKAARGRAKVLRLARQEGATP